MCVCGAPLILLPDGVGLGKVLEQPLCLLPRVEEEEEEEERAMLCPRHPSSIGTSSKKQPLLLPGKEWEEKETFR